MQKKLIVRIADRPDLVPIVAQWLWHEWWHQDGHALEQPDPGCRSRLPGSAVIPVVWALHCRCRARVRVLGGIARRPCIVMAGGRSRSCGVT